LSLRRNLSSFDSYINPIDKALIFYYLEDFSGKEMAKQIGISEGNARVKLNRAKDQLKELINKRASRD